MTMSDLIGWLWAILVVLGVGGLGFTIDAYDSAKTRSERRKNRRQAAATRELIGKKNLVGDALRLSLARESSHGRVLETLHANKMTRVECYLPAMSRD